MFQPRRDFSQNHQAHQNASHWLRPHLLHQIFHTPPDSKHCPSVFPKRASHCSWKCNQVNSPKAETSLNVNQKRKRKHLSPNSFQDGQECKHLYTYPLLKKAGEVRANILWQCEEMNTKRVSQICSLGTASGRGLRDNCMYLTAGHFWAQCSAGGFPVSLSQLPISRIKTGPELSSAVDLYSAVVN